MKVKSFLLAFKKRYDAFIGKSTNIQRNIWVFLLMVGFFSMLAIQESSDRKCVKLMKVGLLDNMCRPMYFDGQGHIAKSLENYREKPMNSVLGTMIEIITDDKPAPGRLGGEAEFYEEIERDCFIIYIAMFVAIIPAIYLAVLIAPYVDKIRTLPDLLEATMHPLVYEAGFR